MEEEGRPRRREQRGERVVVVSAAPVGKAIGPAAEVAAAGPMKESQGQGSPVSSRTRAPVAGLIILVEPGRGATRWSSAHSSAQCNRKHT